MPRREWTKEEVEYLDERWGQVSLNGICKKLNRSINSVKLKAQRMGLTNPAEHFDGLTMHQLSIAIGTPYTTMKTWIKTHGFPARRKVFCKELEVWVVRYDEFWNWAEKNKSRINFAKFEPLAIGPEPEWVKDKRDADILRNKKPHNTPWSEQDDSKLLDLISHYNYSYSEIAIKLNRTEAAVKRRLFDIKHPGRPIGRDTHIKYTQEEVDTICEMIEKGYSIDVIARKTGKSALGIRGKLNRMGFQFKKAR